ncbi:MAG TPA: carbonic anhydrase [Isosphaeraceae bacterium]|nr:carbonic anhydrase [Isosphaeraceae bacterium]
MNDLSMTRRGWIAAAGLPLSAAAARTQGDDRPDNAGPEEAAEALIRLRDGNLRFAAGRVRHAHQAAAWREHLKESQQPFATILACSDSRVPPELVFDQGFGDLLSCALVGAVYDIANGTVRFLD